MMHLHNKNNKQPSQKSVQRSSTLLPLLSIY
jgi:hypothetical protein